LCTILLYRAGGTAQILLQSSFYNPGSRRASVGMAGSNANHYFSPRNFVTASRAREILDSLRLSLPTVAPGQTPGALRFVSLVLHILPQ